MKSLRDEIRAERGLQVSAESMAQRGIAEFMPKRALRAEIAQDKARRARKMKPYSHTAIRPSRWLNAVSHDLCQKEL